MGFTKIFIFSIRVALQYQKHLLHTIDIILEVELPNIGLEFLYIRLTLF